MHWIGFRQWNPRDSRDGPGAVIGIALLRVELLSIRVAADHRKVGARHVGAT